MTRVGSKSQLNPTMLEKKPRPAFRQRAAASTLLQSIWWKARRAASVSFILTSETIVNDSTSPGSRQLDFSPVASFLGPDSVLLHALAPGILRRHRSGSRLPLVDSAYSERLQHHW